MAKFNYKFASVQRIKYAIEKKTQKELSEIDLAIARENKKIAELEVERKKMKEEILSKKNIKVVELKFYENFEKNFNEKKETIELEIKELQKKRKMKQEDLLEKSKETKMFDKLEIKHYSEFIKEQNKLEQIEMDDIATKKFVRGTKK